MSNPRRKQIAFYMQGLMRIALCTHYLTIFVSKKPRKPGSLAPEHLSVVELKPASSLLMVYYESPTPGATVHM